MSALGEGRGTLAASSASACHLQPSSLVSIRVVFYSRHILLWQDPDTRAFAMVWSFHPSQRSGWTLGTHVHMGTCSQVLPRFRGHQHLAVAPREQQGQPPRTGSCPSSGRLEAFTPFANDTCTRSPLQPRPTPRLKCEPHLSYSS